MCAANQEYLHGGRARCAEGFDQGAGLMRAAAPLVSKDNQQTALREV